MARSQWKRALQVATFVYILLATVYRSIYSALTLVPPHSVEDEALLIAPQRGRVLQGHHDMTEERRRDDPEITLPFGFEIEYLFPNTTEFTVDMEDPAGERMQDVRAALLQAGISSTVYLNKYVSKQVRLNDSWRLLREHSGFELVSPVLRSLEPVQAALDVMKRLGVTSHPKYNCFHASIDAYNKTVEQIRNVYKNFVVVEKALDEIRDAPQRANHSIRSLSIAQQFPSNQIAFQRLDACGNKIKCLRRTAEPFWDSMHYHLLNFRWTRVFDNSTTKKKKTVPVRLEFRGQAAVVEYDFVAAWIRLLHNFVQASFNGIVLDSREQTVEEAWSALFDELVQDDKLRAYFDKRRIRLQQEPPEILLIQSLELQRHLERIRQKTHNNGPDVR